MKHVLAAALFVCPLFAAPVTITGTIRRPDGSLVTGIATIELSVPCIVGGSLILDRTITVGFSNGAFSKALEPTTTCPSTTYYRVRYRIDRVWSQTYEYWSVPPSPTTTTIEAVRLDPGNPPTSGGGGSGVGTWTSPSLNFGTIQDLACADLSFTATGLTVGTPLLVVPYAGIGLVSVSAWPSAADTAKIRVCNSSGADIGVNGVFAVKAGLGYLSSAATLDFPSVIAGGSQVLTVTVAGATTSMGAIVAPPAAFEAGLSLSARVTAANTVSVIAHNFTDSDINPASGSFVGMVIQ